MKRQFLAVTISLILLTACSDGESTQGSKDTTTMTTPVPPKSYYYDDAQIEILKVRPKSYYNSMLTYEYEGKEYTLPLDYNVFNEGNKKNAARPSISETVINKYSGEDIYASIALSEDKSKIVFCDVLSPNKIYRYTHHDMAVECGIDLGMGHQNDGDVSIKRVGDTEVEFSNGKKTVRGDINDMSSFYKGNIIDVPERVNGFDSYIMKDGRIILSIVHTETQGDRGFTTQGMPAFCGRIQSISGKRAEVLLNDSVTTCDVPCVLYDEKLSVGQKVVLILDTGIDLYNSGKAYKSDYAVFVTRYQFYGLADDKFDDCAYLKQSETDLYNRDIITKDKA